MFKPTDEQYAALRSQFASAGIGAEIHAKPERLFAHESMQAIIRAAQAEALRQFIERRPNPAKGGTHHGPDQAMYSSQQIDQWIESADV